MKRKKNIECYFEGNIFYETENSGLVLSNVTKCDEHFEMTKEKVRGKLQNELHAFRISTGL